jgi:CP family cyanate transporter-like MFS transporter
MWSIVSLFGALPWLVIIPYAKRRGLAEAELDATLPIPLTSVPLSKSPTAVSIMTIFAISGATAYSWFALLPLMLTDLVGFTRGESALALGLFTISGLPLSLIIPPLASRRGWAGPLVAVAIIAGAGGLFGLLLAPGVWVWLWISLICVGPMTFHMSLTLITARAKNHFSALQLSGYVNRVGYLLAAVGPLLVGLGYQLTGEWSVSLIMLLGLVALQVPAVWILGRERIVDDELSDQRS